MNILFVCVHNSGRSQMAEAFAKELAGNTVYAASAGTVSRNEINPMVVAAMAEKGIDISAARPKLIQQEMVDTADLVVTMGCAIDESCPAVFIPSEDWGLDDPAGEPLEVVRRVRDEVEAKVRALLQQMGK
jgi:arsenate reductase